jgi:hypothetical protein
VTRTYNDDVKDVHKLILFADAKFRKNIV